MWKQIFLVGLFSRENFFLSLCETALTKTLLWKHSVETLIRRLFLSCILYHSDPEHSHASFKWVQNFPKDVITACDPVHSSLYTRHQARREGGAKGAMARPQLGKILIFLSKWPFLEKFSLWVCILSTFSKFAPPSSRQRQKFPF